MTALIIIVGVVLVLMISYGINNQKEEEKEEQRRIAREKNIAARAAAALAAASSSNGQYSAPSRKLELDNSTQGDVAANQPPIKMLHRDGYPDSDEWDTIIADVAELCTAKDIGGFFGFVAKDSKNPEKPNAMGIYNDFGRLVGYIPEEELADYRQWCDDSAMPCGGFIQMDSSTGKLRGFVKIVRPCNEDYMKNSLLKYFQWVVDNYGDRYVPKRVFAWNVE